MQYEDVIKRMIDIHKRKNADYGASYLLSVQLLNIPSYVGLLIRMSDKLARACRLVQIRSPKVQDESIVDTLLDLANYAILAVMELQDESRHHGKH